MSKLWTGVSLHLFPKHNKATTKTNYKSYRQSITNEPFPGSWLNYEIPYSYFFPLQKNENTSLLVYNKSETVISCLTSQTITTKPFPAS